MDTGYPTISLQVHSGYRIAVIRRNSQPVDFAHYGQWRTVKAGARLPIVTS